MKKLSHNIIFNILGNLFVILYGIVLLPLILSALGAESAGIIGFYNTIFAAISFFDLGLGILANREISKSNDKNNIELITLISTLEIIYWIISFLIFLIIFLTAPYLGSEVIDSEGFTEDQLVFFIRIIALSIFFKWPVSFYFNLNSGIQNLIGVNIIKIIIYILLMISLYVLIIYFGYEIAEYLIILAVINLILVFSYTFIFKIKFGFHRLTFKFSTIKKHLSYAFGSMIISTLTLMLFQLDKFFLTFRGKLSDFGIYTVIFSLTIGIVQLIYPFTYAFFPKINELLAKNRKKELYEKINLICSILILIAFSFMVTILSFKIEILSFWINKYNSQSNQMIFVFLVLGSTFYAITQIPYLLESALGKTKFVVKFFLGINLIYLLLLFYLEHQIGVIGVSLAYLIVNVLYFFGGIYLFYINISIKMTRKWIVYIIKNSLISLGLFFFILKIKIINSNLFITFAQLSFFFLFVSSVFIISNYNLRVLFLNKFKIGLKKLKK